MGADHPAGYTVATSVYRLGGFVDPLKAEGQVELSRNLQIATALVDSTGLCLFVAMAMHDIPEELPTVVEMINAMYGTSLNEDGALARSAHGSHGNTGQIMSFRNKLPREIVAYWDSYI